VHPPAFVLLGFGDGGHVRMFLQVLAQRLAENAHAAAGDDTHAREPREKGAVDKTFRLRWWLRRRLRRITLISVGALESSLSVTGPSRRAAATGFGAPLFLRAAPPGENFATSWRGNLHLHVADLNFKGVLVEFALDHGGTAKRLELDGIALRDVLDLMRARVRIALVRAVLCATTPASNCSLNSRRSLAMRCSACLESFLRGGAVLHGADGLTHLVLKVLDERFILRSNSRTFCRCSCWPSFSSASSRARDPVRVLRCMALTFKDRAARVRRSTNLLTSWFGRGQAFTRASVICSIEPRRCAMYDARRRSGTPTRSS